MWAVVGGWPPRVSAGGRTRAQPGLSWLRGHNQEPCLQKARPPLPGPPLSPGAVLRVLLPPSPARPRARTPSVPRASFSPPNSNRTSNSGLPEIWIVVSSPKSLKVSLQCGALDSTQSYADKGNMLYRMTTEYLRVTFTHTEEKKMRAE